MELKSASPYRKYLIGLDTEIPLGNGQFTTYINFDNAATTPPLKSVLQAINNFAPWYSSIHRGKGYKSRLSSDFYEESRRIILKFIGGDPAAHNVIYVKNTSEAINKLANRLVQINDQQSLVLSTEMEHHSNDLPWRKNFPVDFIAVNQRGQLCLADLEAKLIKYRGRVKLVVLTGASNVTGYINPIHQAAGLSHQYGAQIMVDGAQLVPHYPVDIKPIDHPEHIDYLVFSAHKMYAPFGSGVLIGPCATFKRGTPDHVGGGTIKVVTTNSVYWADPPQKDEVGTPNIMGVVALVEAIKTLQRLNLKEIAAYEQALTEYAIKRLINLPGIQIFNDQPNNCSCRNNPEKVSIIPINLRNISHQTLAQLLAERAGIAVRNGCFCAQPYIQKLLNLSTSEIKRYLSQPDLVRPGLVRISFGMYNQTSEVDQLINSLEGIIKL